MGRQLIIRKLQQYQGLQYALVHDKYLAQDQYLHNTERVKCQAKIDLLNELLRELEERDYNE